MAQQPIIKLLTAAGAGSRRQVAAAIKRGGVTVNGQVIEGFNTPVDPAKDAITIDGKRIPLQAEPRVYLMLNKPAGVVSTTTDARGETTVIDMLPEKYRHLRVYPVGRLDKDSTGLMLLTNDGELTYRLTHPKFEQEKEYLVHIEGKLAPEEIKKLEAGIELVDGKTSPAKVAATGQQPFNYSITIHEGRKRQVRRMFAALGYMVQELKRVRFGSLRLGTLPEGGIRELTAGEVKSLNNLSSRYNRNHE